jgi:gluconate 2-dehydrogenase gamma chain
LTDSGKSVGNQGRRSFIKLGAGVIAGAAVATVVEVPFYNSIVNGSKSSDVAKLQSELASANSHISQLNAQLSSAHSTLQGHLTSAGIKQTALQTSVASYSEIADALTTLNIQEAAVVAAAAEAIIPTDSNGPGANEAGVIYFIDRQLNGDYGNNGRMYNAGPFITPNTPGPITVQGITYSAGSPNTPWVAGQTYQYSMSLRNFWHYGIMALETYATSAYGGVFESLSTANQVACLQDLFNNKPTSFNSIIPSDFANELFFMTWCGFLMDPMYGGNRGMVGWVLTASPGLNNGNFYGEGQTPQQRMVASTPTILKPASLAQFQQASNVPGVLGGTSSSSSSSSSTTTTSAPTTTTSSSQSATATSSSTTTSSGSA